MKRYLLGIDAKILPNPKGSEVWEKAKVIEGNGRTTGISMLNYGDGFKKYLKSLQLGDKILVYFHIDSNPLNPDNDIMQKFQEKVDNLYGRRYPFHQVIEWVDDLPRRYAQKRRNQYDRGFERADQNVDTLVDVANELDLVVLKIASYNFSEHGIRYALIPNTQTVDAIKEFTSIRAVPNGNYLSWRDIALVDGFSNTLLEDVVPGEKYMNNLFLEELLSDKALLYYLDSLFPDTSVDLKKYFPDSTLWGCGMNSFKSVKEWMENYKGQLKIRKPFDGLQGRGLRLFRTPTFLKGMTSHVTEPDLVEAAYTNMTLDLLHLVKEVGQRSVIIQEFIPSIEIPYERDVYDGCSRSLVINNNFISVGWRLGLYPLGSEVPMEQIHVANTSLGSETVAMSSEHTDIVAELSESFSEDFLTLAQEVRERMNDAKFGLFANDKYYHPVDQIRILFNLQRLFKSAQEVCDLQEVYRKHFPAELAEHLREVEETLD
tara:strand:- start:3906 stop:5369 length:1464 start_codon:yes stop_codon:yes gene_type:complete